MMLDTWDGQIFFPRFYDIDTILSYDNSGEIKFEADIEMEQGYWNTSSSRLWTKVRDLFHDELIETYKDMRANGVTYESIMHYMYDEQIAKIPQKYYNMDYDIKYAPYSDQYLGKAHGDGLQHMKRWLKRRFLFCDTLYDYAPSYNNDVLTIRANTTEEMTLEIETYSPVYQHVSWYNGQMDKKKINGKTSVTFNGLSQTATDQEVLIYGGSNIKSIKGISSMNPNSMLIGGATRLTELDISNCPILTIVNSNKANFSPHSYLNKLNISNCPQLGGNLNVSNSPLLQEINAKGSGITGLLMPTSLRNLKTLRLPNTLNELTLNDVPLLNTLEFDEGANLQSVSLTNCNQLDNCINFDLTKTPTVSLDNSYNTDELYMSATTDLTLKNMPTLERVVFTPNNEYSEFDINNVLNAPNYKVTTFNNPRMTDFIVTAPHRDSYNGDDVEYREGLPYVELLDGTYIKGGYWSDEGVYTSSDKKFQYTTIIPSGVTTVHIKTNGMATTDHHVRVTYFQDDTFLERLLISYTTTNGDIDQDINIPTNCNKIIFVCDETYMSSCTYTLSESDGIIRKDYGDITPNTVFTANTLDLSDTQFTDIKLLSTTDVYNLKVPTSMKNFYCDSAMDIDEDVIVDGGYDVIHNELIEPYTTNYEGEIVKYDDVTRIILESDMTLGQMNHNTGDINDSTWCYVTDYIPVIGGTSITVTVATELDTKWSRALIVCGFDSNKKFVEGYTSASNTYKASTPYTFNISENIAYIRISTQGESHTLKYMTSRVPNIIPSSANGSLIFNMYSNNTTAPTSTSPYMWDLTGLKLNDFHTFGMNNWVKYENNGYTITCMLGDRNTYNKVDKQNNRFTTTFIPIALYGDFKNIDIPNQNAINWWKLNADNSITLGSPKNSGVDYFAIQIYMSANTTMDTLQGKSFMLGDNVFYINMVDAPRNTESELVSDKTGCVEKFNPSSITMPQRMSGYSVRMVNADITPNNYATHLYPLLVDTTLPITGKLDYTKYQGNTLAWAYAYTTSDVTINPLDSRNQGNITNDYNKLYGTDYVDIVDVWVYKDTNVSNFSTNTAITKAYIELTSANYKTRIDEVLQYYPNCTELHIFDDGTVTTLRDFIGTGYSYTNYNTNSAKQIKKVYFMDGYFINLTSLFFAFRGTKIESIYNIPNSVTDIDGLTYGSTISYISNFPTSVTNFNEVFRENKVIKEIPPIPNTVTTMTSCFYGCTALTTAPTVPNGVTKMKDCYRSCTNLMIIPNIPSSCTDFSGMCQDSSNITSVPVRGWKGNMNSTFRECKKLNQQIVIENATSLASTFFRNSAMVNPPTISINGSVSMECAFQHCSSLIVAPTIPDGVTNMNSCFSGCSSLTKGVVNMPNTCNDMSALYYGCSSLQTCEIPINVDKCTNALYNVPSTCDITWVGERTTNLSLTSSQLYWNGNQRDIQELVPEHLADLSASGGSATLTLGDTYGSYLTKDEVFLANQKGWTIVGASSDFAIINAEDDVSTFVTDELITSCFIELTADNKSSRVNEVLQWYPNCHEVHFYHDDTLTSLSSIFQNNTTYRSQIHKIVFMDGYFPNDTYSLKFTFAGCTKLVEIVNLPKPNSTQGTFQNCESLTTHIDWSDCTDTLNLSSTFQNCKALVTPPILPPKVSDMIGCFNGCSGLVTPPVLTSGFTNMEKTFYGCSKLATAPVIPNGVTNLTETFYNCSALVTVPKLPESVTTMKSTFRATALTVAPDIPSKVTTLYKCFDNCKSLTTAPKTIPAGVTSMECMFGYCVNLVTTPNNIPEGVTTLKQCFIQTSITSAPTIPSTVTNLNSTFHSCNKLVHSPEILSTSVTDVSYLYYNCSKLEDAYMPVYGNCVKYGSYHPFNNCSKLTKVTWIGEASGNDFNVRNYASSIDILPKDSIIDLVENHLGTTSGNTLTLGDTYLGYLTDGKIAIALMKGWTVAGAGTIPNITTTTDTTSLTSDTSVTTCLIQVNDTNYTTRLDEVCAVYPNTTSICLYGDGTCTDLSSMLNCNTANNPGYNATYKAQIKEVHFIKGGFVNPLDLNCMTTGTTTGLNSLEYIDLSYTKISKPTYMFQACIYLKTVDLTGTVFTGQSFHSMFINCYALEDIIGFEDLDVSQIRTWQVTFQNCYALRQLDFSHMNLGKASTFDGTFRGIKSWTEIDLGSKCEAFNTIRNVDYWGNTFRGCENLQYINMSKFSMNNVKASSSIVDIFYKCYELTNIEPATGLYLSHDLSYCTKLSADELVQWFNAIGTTTSGATITLGETLLAKLTDDQKAIAINKGWTLA